MLTFFFSGMLVQALHSALREVDVLIWTSSQMGSRLCYKDRVRRLVESHVPVVSEPRGNNMQTSHYLWLVPGDRDSTWGSFCLKERIPANYTKAHTFTGTLKHHLSVRVVHCSLLKHRLFRTQEVISYCASFFLNSEFSFELREEFPGQQGNISTPLYWSWKV